MIEGLVTIVVPVYKTEKYLDCCVDSIVKQTYRNLEIILVDDGSPDNCGRICDEWAAKDNRIKVIHQENQGLSAARNAGIENASGEYICFFDSDDFVTADFVESTYMLAQKECVEMVICGIASTREDGSVINRFIPKPKKLCYRHAAVQEEFLPDIVGHNPKTGESSNVVLSACCVLFSMRLLQKAQWKFVSEKIVLSEDVYSLLVLYKDVQSVAILAEAKYFYRSNESSTSRSYRADRMERNNHFYEMCVALCDQNGYSQEVCRRCKEPYLANIFGAMKQTVAVHKSYRNVIPELRKMIDDPIYQKVIFEKKQDKESFNKKVFYWAARNKLYFLCYLLLAAKLR